MAIRAFVAGASGYTGREVVRALRHRNASVTAHVRHDSPSLATSRLTFERLGAVVDSTPWTPAAMAESLTRIRPTHVFALLGITRARARRRARAGAPPESYASVDYGLVAMLLEATRRSAATARFIYLSSLGASETAGGEYLRVRGRLEREIRASGLSALIVRPSLITGPDREEARPTERVAAFLVDRGLSLARLVGGRSLQQRYRSRTAAELAEAIARLALEAGPGVRVVDGRDLDQGS
jgi:nucleoside-diphosphate-sugar epimerase